MGRGIQSLTCSVDFDWYDHQTVPLVVVVVEAVVAVDFVLVHQNISSLNHQVFEFVLR
jgi:hypothetical protein